MIFLKGYILRGLLRMRGISPRDANLFQEIEQLRDGCNVSLPRKICDRNNCTEFQRMFTVFGALGPAPAQKNTLHARA